MTKEKKQKIEVKIEIGENLEHLLYSFTNTQSIMKALKDIFKEVAKMGDKDIKIEQMK